MHITSLLPLLLPSLTPPIRISHSLTTIAITTTTITSSSTSFPGWRIASPLRLSPSPPLPLPSPLISSPPIPPLIITPPPWSFGFPKSVLTPAQVWEGLRRKVRHADQFVPPITSCIVDREEDNVVHRRVIFEGSKEMSEVCTELAPHRVDFRLEDGTEIENILAPGPSGDETDLYLTYSFKWKFPKIERGSTEERDMLAEQQKVSLIPRWLTIQLLTRL